MAPRSAAGRPGAHAEALPENHLTPRRSGRAGASRSGLAAQVLRSAAALAVVAACLGGGTAAYASTRGHDDLARVRAATAQFHRLDAADAAGYERFVDVDGIACIDMPDMGAMGVHYVNQSLVGDPAIDPVTPEALVYAPTADGGQQLVAVEYIVLQSAWDAGHDAPPSLFGRSFDVTPSPNRFGLPAFYSLHAWVWKHNPAGTFSMWNPAVSCENPVSHAGRSGHAHHGGGGLYGSG